MLRRVRLFYEKFLEVVVIVLMAALAIEVTLGVVFRTLGESLVWYDEIASILLAWVTYYGAALAALRRAHLGVPELVHAMPPRLRLLAAVFAEACVIGFFVLMAWVGVAVLDVLATDNLVSIPEISVVYTQSVIPISAVLFVIAATVLTWRRAALPGAGWPWQVGKAVSAIAAIGALAFSVAFASMTVTVYNVSQARRTFATYELIYDPATRVITFSGPIGPGFADRLGGILSSNAGVRVLRIADSPGGLIDEAMSAAERIEREPGLAVEAAGECNSACFALFMAAEDRRAEYTAEFGFHRSGFVSDLPAFVRQAAESEGDGFRAYLIERGLPVRESTAEPQRPQR